jgi:SulP family sulfate permease
MLLAMAAHRIFNLTTVATIGTAFGGIPQVLPALHWPALTLTDVLQLVGPAFTIALLGAIESLLTAVVADGMVGTHHDSNQELIGQGAANILSPLFGGFAATGAIARTATNIRNGATSPLAGIVHAIFLVLVILFLAPWAANIPLAALSAILFYVAWNMSDARHFARLLQTAPRADKLILLITFCLTVFVDLVVAVNVGVVLAALLFMRNMADSVTAQEQDFEAASDVRLPKSVLVYRIEGPFFFGAAEKLQTSLRRAQVHVETVVIRLGQVPFFDSTGMQTLGEIIERYQKSKIRVMLCGLRPALRAELEPSGILDRVGADNICTNLSEVATKVQAAAAG